jgi:predicted small lipoprotein YifL
MKVLLTAIDKFGLFRSWIRTSNNSCASHYLPQGERICDRRLSFLFFIFLIQVLFVLGSCGKKGPPMPPKEAFFIKDAQVTFTKTTDPESKESQR